MEQHPLKLAAIPCNIGPDAVPAKLTALAQRAEALGYESLWTFEHVIVPHQYASRYPYHPSGKMGAAPDTNFLDPLIALTYLAAATKHLRFGTGVNILPQVNPLLLAKQAATLDFLSGGRLLLGLGVGWLKEEFEAMGGRFCPPRDALHGVHPGITRSLARRGGCVIQGAVFAMARVWHESAAGTGGRDSCRGRWCE